MTREEAIKALERAEDYAGIQCVNNCVGAYISPYLLKAIDFAISALREQEELRWIPVTERLPDLELVDTKNDGFDLCSCLVTVKNFRVKNGRYVKKAWYNGYGFRGENCIIITRDVTHWMPLPETPKEG